MGMGMAVQPAVAQSGGVSGSIGATGGSPGSTGLPPLPAPGIDTGLPSMAGDCMCKVMLVTTGMRPASTSWV